MRRLMKMNPMKREMARTGIITLNTPTCPEKHSINSIFLVNNLIF